MLFLTLNHIKVLVLLCYLLVVIFIALFSWLYLSRTIRAAKSFGLHAPEYIKIIVRVSIVTAMLTALLIVFLILITMY